MKNKFFFVILFLLLTVLCFAEEKFPVNIEADGVKYFGKEQYSIFSGNVKATYKDMKLYADIMKVVFDSNKEVENIFCTGNVKMVKEGMYSLSKEAEIKVKENILILKGNAKVWQGENYLYQMSYSSITSRLWGYYLNIFFYNIWGISYCSRQTNPFQNRYIV